MSTDYWKRINYKTPVKYFINTYIREYDLSKANITALLYQNRLSLSEYNEYLTMRKELREKKVGLLIRSDRSIYKDIQAGIIEAKKRLLTLNSVEDFNIVSFDNLALKQLDLQNEMPQEEWEKYFLGDDGDYTFYVDLVKEEFAISSTNTMRQPINGRTVIQMFNEVRRMKEDMTYATNS